MSRSEISTLSISGLKYAKEKIYVNTWNNFGWGWGWGFNPWFWGGGGPGFNNTISTQTEGTLYINIIDAATKQLVWQGKGKGVLNENYKKRDERIALFVEEIVENYPPNLE